MKSKSVIVAILLLIGVNTSFLWERADWDFGIAILLMFVWVILGFVFILKLGGLLIDRFKKTRPIISTAIIGVILLLTFLYPFGLFRPENFKDPPIAVAQREGVANCSTTIVLKNKFRFKETSVCFGVKRAEGNYQINGDTLKFDFDDLSIFGSDKAMAIIKLNTDSSKTWIGNLIYYRNSQDTVPLTMTLTKFEKEKLKKHEGTTKNKANAAIRSSVDHDV